MSTLDYDEVKPRKYIIYDDEPYEVLESHVARTQKRKPQNSVKLKNLVTGRVVPTVFHASDSAEEAEISRRNAKFLYSSKGEYWFCEPSNPSKRFQISAEVLGDDSKWLKDNMEVQLLIWGEDEDEKILGAKVPVKVVYEVKEAPPAIKGNTASGGDKLVTLENGAQVTTPLFIEIGEKILVNTETGTYVERYNEK